MEGKEAFYSFPFSTVPHSNENAFLIGPFLEWLKASGYFYHFKDAAINQGGQNTVEETRRLLLMGSERNSAMDGEAGGSIGLSDSLIVESLLLFVYCFVACVMCILWQALRLQGQRRLDALVDRLKQLWS